MDYETLRYERDGHVVVLTYDRPEQRNAVSRRMNDELHHAWRRFRDDDDAFVLVITGAGDAFCAGWDLADAAALEQPDWDFFRVSMYDSPGECGYTRRVDVFKPVIAAVNGWAVAAGLENALLADIRIAARNAVFGALERRWNIVGGDGLTVRLPLVVGYAKAMELIITGRAVDADEALRIGLANEVVDEGRALDRALGARARDRRAAAGRDPHRQGDGHAQRRAHLEERLRNEAEATWSMFMRRDSHREGAGAFKERRRPSGRTTACDAQRGSSPATWRSTCAPCRAEPQARRGPDGGEVDAPSALEPVRSARTNRVRGRCGPPSATPTAGRRRAAAEDAARAHRQPAGDPRRVAGRGTGGRPRDRLGVHRHGREDDVVAREVQPRRVGPQAGLPEHDGPAPEVAVGAVDRGRVVARAPRADVDRERARGGRPARPDRRRDDALGAGAAEAVVEEDAALGDRRRAARAVGPGDGERRRAPRPARRTPRARPVRTTWSGAIRNAVTAGASHPSCAAAWSTGSATAATRTSGASRRRRIPRSPKSGRAA